MSKKALALRAIGDQMSGEEMEGARHAAEKALGDDYNVLLYDSTIEAMDMDDLLGELKDLVEHVEEKADHRDMGGQEGDTATQQAAAEAIEDQLPDPTIRTYSDGAIEVAINRDYMREPGDGFDQIDNEDLPGEWAITNVTWSQGGIAFDVKNAPE